MTQMNPTEFCRLVETQLGWEPPPTGKPWLKYQAEVGKVNRLRSTDPTLYSWKNLRLAVELLRRQKQSRTPVGVFSHVQTAVDQAHGQESPTECEIRRVLAFEQGRGDPNGWVERFARTTGTANRADALTAWRWT